MSYFRVGSMVLPRVAAQGMVPGRIYCVAAVDERVTPFGVFSTYRLVWDLDPQRPLSVCNLHLLADQVAPPGWKLLLRMPEQLIELISPADRHWLCSFEDLVEVARRAEIDDEALSARLPRDVLADEAMRQDSGTGGAS